MPTLNWIGKDKVINHHLDVPYRVLERKYSFDETGEHKEDNGSANMIIHGDNLEALKALLPQYEGGVKCIYIDPPYNTGNENWVYNDNVNDSRMVKWLGEVVGKEGEDLSRHDKWLCMMYPRLKLLQRLLTKDGIIFISIDDNELYNLKMLCDEIFGANNFVATCVWQGSKKGDAKLISVSHEYIMIYVANKAEMAANKTMWRKPKQGLDEIFSYYHSLREKYGHDHVMIQKEMKAWYKLLPDDSPCRAHKHYCYSDDRGLYFADNFAGPNDGRDNRPRYDIIHPVTGQPCKKPATGWRWDEEHTKAALAENPPRIHFGATHETIPCRKSYLADVDKEPFSSVFYRDGRGASSLVDQILGKNSFDFPKDPDIIAQLIHMVTSEDDIILDSFAGSGTTAHAVLSLNRESGNRKFILVEMLEYAETKTAKRVKKVIAGYQSGKSRIAGIGGDFSFYELGEPLFVDNQLNQAVGADKIREYVYFMETKQHIVPLKVDEPFYMGTYMSTAYYFYYEPDAITTLGHSFLHTVKSKADMYVIYADICILNEKELEKCHIIFKKIPRDISKL
ncbi:MAG: site-specific DNA-methyltransferase [Roseburia sp.]|nr:site-specific DNA-methyltransferase [Roseburia sp.]